MTSEPSQAIDLKSIIQVLMRQRRIMAYTSVMVLVVATLFLGLATPRYTATALLLVEPNRAQLLEGKSAFAPSGSIENARIDSEVEILRSDALMLGVINQMALTDLPEFAPKLPLPNRLARFIGRANAAPADLARANAETLETVRNHLEIKRKGLTYLISVSATAQTPETARDLANTYSKTYIDQAVAAKIETRLSGKSVLSTQLAQARARLAQSEDQFDKFLTTQFGAPQEGFSSAYVGLAQELGKNRASQLSRIEMMRALQQPLANKEWDVIAATLGNPEIEGLVTNRSSQEITDDHRAEVARIDRLLESKVNAELDVMTREVTELDQQAANLRDQLRRALPDQSLTSTQLTALYDLQQQGQVARNQYQRLLERMHEMETEAALQVADSRLVSPAILPVRSSYPNSSMVLLIALASAMGLGVSMAFLNEYFIGGVTSHVQLAEILKTPAITTIPESDELNAGRLSPADRIIDAPLSGYSETHRKLRAALDHDLRQRPQSGGDKGNVIPVFSSVGAEGKTTVALALARTYALAGRKTLLIDADLRRPSIHQHLGIQPEFGFGDFLRAPKTPDAMKRFYARDPSSKTAIILGAKQALNATDPLLMSDAFQNVIEQARDIYDVTIIDTSPLLPVVDASYVARHADAAVFVARFVETAQSDIRAGFQLLNEVLPVGTRSVPVLSRSRAPQISSEYGPYYQTHSAAT